MMTRLIFAGYGGQGVILAGKLLAVAAMKSGKCVSHIPSYGVEMRGGTANCSVVVADEEIPSPLVFSPDIVCIFNEPSLIKFGPIVRKGGLLFFNTSLIDAEPNVPGVTCIPVPANTLAEEAGSYQTANMVMVGALVARVPELASLSALIAALPSTVSARKKDLLQLNEKALKSGFDLIQAPVSR
ncbi:MAG: 2-oxoacid:acceptor oxidoreductase family protein [Spirochaetales bacterium]|nr:2-oxoacid:acceptor oxidoreductase family protein [Spirochaetales bacterium]